MGKVTTDALLKMRDLITEMEPNLHHNDNTILCCNRLALMMEVLVFDGTMLVVNGEILHHEGDKEYEARLKEMESKKHGTGE